MTFIDGFRLEFDDGTVFEATKNVASTHSVTPIYLVDGLRNLQAIINEYFDTTGGQPGRGDSNMAGVFGGFGAGVHEIQIEFTQYEGSTDEWPGADSDHALTKRDRLANAITTKKMDSTAVGLLRVGEYNPNGLYNEIPVVPSEVNLPYSPVSDAGTTSFRGTMTFYDAVDIDQAVSAVGVR